MILLDDPTVGVDVGAKSDILELIRGFARNGKAVLMASSDFEELLAVCDRVLVLADGGIVAELDAARTTEAEVLCDRERPRLGRNPNRPHVAGHAGRLHRRRVGKPA